MPAIKKNAALPVSAIRSKKLPTAPRKPAGGHLKGSQPELPVDTLDTFLRNIRLLRISLSSCHAIIILYGQFLKRNKLFNLSSLATQLGVTTAATTSVADSIEKLGFAKRITGPGDRREVMITLTPSGIRFAESCGSSISTATQRATDVTQA